MPDHPGLMAMTKVEVVVEGTDAPLVEQLVTQAGASGFTAVSNVSGLGHGGYHQGRLQFNDRNALSLLIVVLPTERADDLIAGLRHLFDRRPGVLLVSDVWVSRPDYFTSQSPGS